MNPDTTQRIDQLFAAADDKLARLASLDPLLIDVSLREPCFDSPLGHTLQNKLELLPMIDAFGIADKVIATLDYQLEEFPQVEDDFCRYLRDTGYDMTGCFALTAVGQLGPYGFEPDHSEKKLVDYGIPNTMNEIYLLPRAGTVQQMLDRLTASVDWLRDNLPPEQGKPGRVFMNVVDLIDAFFADREYACAVVAHLATLRVDALSFEDARGTYFPFQVGAAAAAAKALLRPDQKLVFHVHAGNGMDNASVLEALLQGADGYWGGMDRESSTVGHAPVSDLIANLLRAGNENMHRYKVEHLLPICHSMHRINTERESPATWPIQGSNAYRMMLSGFEQVADRKMDLPAAAIGGVERHRISPVGSDQDVIVARVREALDIVIDDKVAVRMILLMRGDLRDGLRIHYDEPDKLRQLVQRASQ